MAFQDIDRLNKPYMPPQKISLKKKGEAWRNKCVDYVIGQCSSANMWCNNPHRINTYNENFNVYEGHVDEEDLKYITNPFNVDDKLPARLKDYNLVRPLIDSMVGEEVNRPFKFTIARTSENAKNDYLEEHKQMLIDYVLAKVMSQIDPSLQQSFDQQIQSGQIQPPEEVQNYMNENYKDIAEEFNMALLKYLINKLEVRTAFIDGYKDLLLNREEIYYVGEEYGHPVLRRVNPSMFCYEYFPDMTYIEDASWCAERIICSWAELHDRFGDELEESQLDEILKRFEGRGGPTAMGDDKGPYGMGVYHEEWVDVTGIPYPFSVASADTIPIWKVHWKSFRKIFFISINDPETNVPQKMIVDENYVFTGDEEDVEEEWIMEVWQGYKVSGDIYFGVRPITIATDHDDPTSIKLPYCGLAAQGKSVLELLKPMHTTYLSLWYRLDLLLARDNGRAIVMDVTQIPKTMGYDVQQWGHMLKSMGVLLINPYENAWNVPGRDGSRPAAFNAFSALDLSVGDSIKMYIELIGKVEELAMKVIGFNPQRLGQVGHRDLNSTTQEALNQSYNTNAALVYMHDMVKQRALKKLMNVALSIRYRDDDLFLSYIGTDGMRMYLDMPQTAMESMDLWVTSSAEEQKRLEEIKNLYQPAMQNGATLVDVIHLMEATNLTEARLKFEEIERRKQQMMQQQEQQQQQMEQAKMQAIEVDRMARIDKENADRQLKKYIADITNQTKVQVAEIQAQLKSQEMDLGQNIDPLEAEKLELEKQKAAGEQDIKQQAAEQNIQKLTGELSFKRQEFELKQQQMLMDMEMKSAEAEAKRSVEWKQLKLKEEEMELKRKALEQELTEMRLQHKLEMEKMRAEFAQQLKVLASEASQEMKVKKVEQAHDTRIERMKEGYEKMMKREDIKAQKALQKDASQTQKQIAKIGNEGREDIEKIKIENEKRKERKAEEKARKAAADKKKSSSGGGGSSGSSSSGSGKSGSPATGNSSSGSSGQSGSGNNGSSEGSSGPSITVTKINLV